MKDVKELHPMTLASLAKIERGISKEISVHRMNIIKEL